MSLWRFAWYVFVGHMVGQAIGWAIARLVFG